MRETYWERFVTTGSVKDYLSYRAEKENPGTGAEKEDAGCQTEPGKHFRKGET